MLVYTQNSLFAFSEAGAERWSGIYPDATAKTERGRFRSDTELGSQTSLKMVRLSNAADLIDLLLTLGRSKEIRVK